jgi:hypothetical protein
MSSATAKETSTNDVRKLLTSESIFMTMYLYVWDAPSKIAEKRIRRGASYADCQSASPKDSTAPKIDAVLCCCAKPCNKWGIVKGNIAMITEVLVLSCKLD